MEVAKCAICLEGNVIGVMKEEGLHFCAEHLPEHLKKLPPPDCLFCADRSNFEDGKPRRIKAKIDLSGYIKNMYLCQRHFDSEMDDWRGKYKYVLVDGCNSMKRFSVLALRNYEI